MVELFRLELTSNKSLDGSLLSAYCGNGFQHILTLVPKIHDTGTTSVSTPHIQHLLVSSGVNISENVLKKKEKYMFIYRNV